MGKVTETRKERIQKGIRHRRAHEKEELRQTILKAAGELFLQQGYERFSMRQLAEQIGYSATTLYLYFRDKDDLLFTIVGEGFTQFEQQLMLAASSSDDPWERLNALGQAYLSFGLNHPVYYQLMFMQRADFLTQASADMPPRLAAFDVLHDAVQYAMDAGAMQSGNAQTCSDVLWAMMHGIVSMSIALPDFDQERTQRLIAVARDVLFKALSQG